jgi:hypothetical protein
MIRRARWTRPVAALFALWFAFVLGDPGLLHRCPMHGGHGAGAIAPTGGENHAMHGEHSAASHTASNDASQDVSHDAPHHGTSSQCTCVGQCCVASVAATLPVVAAAYVPTTISRVEQPFVVALGDAPASADTRLPFANGPPTA